MSKLYQTLLLGIFLCTSVTITQTQAQQTPTESSVADTLELNRVVVTASKIPLSQRETTKPVQIIDRAEIERNSGRDLSQILNQQSGIRVNDSYGAPSNSRILYMQGATAANTLILLDGTPLNDPSGPGGLFDLRLLPTNNIERIEIIKGSQSTLYGTDAVAGVVNVITRSGGEEPVNATGRLAYGSFNSFTGSAGLNGSLGDRVRYTVNYNRESSDGFSAAEEPGGSDESFGDDGFEMDAFFGKADLKVSNDITLSPFLKYSRNDGDYDADAFQDADNTFSLQMINPGVQAAADFGNLRLNGAYSATLTERSFISTFGENDFEGTFHNADLFGNYRINSTFQILTGFNVQDYIIPESEGEEFDENGNPVTVTLSRRDAQIVSPYATVYLKNLAGFNAEIGYRLNSHSEYGRNSTFSFAPSYEISDGLKLFGSATTGFKAPTLDELFGQFGANPDLNPQKSVYFSGGAEATLLDKRLNISAQYFSREVDDLIVFAGQRFINRDKQDDSGIELSADWIVANGVTVGAWYNYLDGEITTTDAEGNEVMEGNLIRRPDHSLGLNAGVQVSDNLLVRLDGEYNGERTDLFFNPQNNFISEEVTLDSYTLVNLYAEYGLANSRVTLFGDVKNLFNSDFTEVYGFKTMGTAVKAGVRFNI
ncbi:MAG: TonB-dependent receptor [Balneolaceae bacterium]